MLAQKPGSIINIASMSDQIVNRPQLHFHYNAAKAGVIQYSRSCTAEWADRGVRLSTLSPGHTVTPMTANAVPRIGPTWVSNTSMGRLGTPDDLQGATVFLASSASAYVTGHDLVVDGGYTLWESAIAHLEENVRIAGTFEQLGEEQMAQIRRSPRVDPPIEGIALPAINILVPDSDWSKKGARQ